MSKKPIDLKTVRDASRSLKELEKDFPELRGRWKAAMRKALAEAEEEKSVEKASKLIAFRFPVSLLARIDSFAERMNLSRAAAVRVLLTRALEGEEKVPPKRRK